MVRLKPFPSGIVNNPPRHAVCRGCVDFSNRHVEDGWIVSPSDRLPTAPSSVRPFLAAAGDQEILPFIMPQTKQDSSRATATVALLWCTPRETSLPYTRCSLRFALSA